LSSRWTCPRRCALLSSLPPPPPRLLEAAHTAPADGLSPQLGGKGAQHNPEQLFGAAYATCYLSAMGATHGNLNKGAKPLPKSTKVDAVVSIGKDADEKLAVRVLSSRTARRSSRGIR